MSVNSISGVDSPVDFGATPSRELTLAMLQLKYSEASKNSATKIMDEIDTIQANQKKANALYQEALKQQKAATATAKTGMNAEMLKYMEENELSFTGAAAEYDSWSATEVLAWFKKYCNQISGNNRLLLYDFSDRAKRPVETEKGKYFWDVTEDKVSMEGVGWLRELNIAYLDSIERPKGYPQDSAGWDTAVSSLKTHLDTMGTETQRKMVFAQDFMGQYNSYLSGAHSVIQQFIQNMGEMARMR
jgi:hypothetical protein